MSNTDLHKRIAELEENNQKLLAENRRLREILGLPDEKILVKVGPVSISSINEYSSPEQKIALLMAFKANSLTGKRSWCLYFIYRSRRLTNLVTI